MSESASPLRSACAIIAEWANAQDHWVRRIVREVLNARQELPENASDDIYLPFLAEQGLDGPSPEDVPALSPPDGEPETIEPFRLTRLAAVEGVNALAPGQEIGFNSRLTILFGENACGKTGYVRVLKSIAAVRTSERVLGNVHASDGGPQRATLGYQIAGRDERTYSWAGESGVAPFTRINVFDSRAVAIHVDEDLSYTYTPRDIALFRYVSDAIDGVRRRLELAQAEARPGSNPFVHRFERDTRAYVKVSVLDAATDLGELEALANVPKDEEDGLAALRQRVEALRPEATQTQLKLANSQLGLLRSLGALAKAILGFDFDAYDAERAAVRLAEEAHREANERAFAGENIPGVLGDAWRELIDSGERYITETHPEGYPKEGDACLYCRQELGRSALRLVKRYRTLAHAGTMHNVSEARAALAARQGLVAEIDVAGIETTVARDAPLLEGRDAILATARSFFPAATAAVAAIQSGQQGDFVAAQTAAQHLVREVAAVVSGTETIVANLTTKAEERQRLYAEASKNLRDLESRILLRQLLPDIESYVGRAKWTARADTAGSKVTPLLKSLTEAAKTASENLLNADFEARFREECKALRAPAVRLDFPGRKGEPARRKSIIPKHKLSEILSEGEQKVIALADFLAEARLRKTGATVVFDDPVTSLDYRRLEHVVDRIVQLAEEQQVVVFTHNIWFTALVLDRFEKRPADITYFDVRSDEGAIGMISKGTSPRMDTPAKVEKKLNMLLQETAKASGETLEALIEHGYDLIRNWCEGFVEQELLQGVSRRYEPNIRMHSLGNIKTDRLPVAIAVVTPIYDKACRVIMAHSQPLETLSVRPTAAGLREDWKVLTDARGAYLRN